MGSKKTTEEVPQPEVIIGVLVSRVDEPVTTSYKGKELRVSPRAKIRKIIKSFLKEPLPKGLIFVRNK